MPEIFVIPISTALHHSLRKILAESNLLHCLFCQCAAEVLGFRLRVNLTGESPKGTGHGRGCFLALQLVGNEKEGPQSNVHSLWVHHPTSPREGEQLKDNLLHCKVKTLLQTGRN